MRGLFDRLSPAPRAYTSGWERSWGLRPRLYAVARFASFIFCWDAVLGLTPQALRCRSLRELYFLLRRGPGAHAPGFTLSSAPRAWGFFF
jgi:hypothetical protein